MDIKAIETQYKGYRFRSRLEARWAVFFDELGVEYAYEVEGFECDGLRFLPDFWLPTQRWWVEVKPAPLSVKECQKAVMLACHGDCPVMLLYGPAPDKAKVAILRVMDKKKGLVHFSDSVKWTHCPRCGAAGIATATLKHALFSCFNPPCNKKGAVKIRRSLAEVESGDVVMRAFRSARAARFEYGENGRSYGRTSLL